MKMLERRMLDILKELKEEYGVLAVKAEFEAEGSRTDELVMLNEIVFRANMEIFIKIGGCEAVRDLDQCRVLGAGGIMAPMIESPFAMQKYVAAAKKVYGSQVNDIEWIINAETKSCYDRLDDILDVGNGFLNAIAIGRVDLSGSMNLCRDEINSQKMFEMTKDMLLKAKNKGLRVGFGGGISFETIPFIVKIAPYADMFETRKIVFRISDNEKHLRGGIFRAMEFEILYLQNKCDFYDRMANEDRGRLEMLSRRLEKAKSELI